MKDAHSVCMIHRSAKDSHTLLVESILQAQRANVWNQEDLLWDRY